MKPFLIKYWKNCRPMGISSVLLLSPFDMNLVPSIACLLFVKTRCFQVHLVYFLSRPKNRQFSRKQYFKTTILALETLNLIGLDIVLWPLQRTELGQSQVEGWGGGGVGCPREGQREGFFLSKFILMNPCQINIAGIFLALSYIASVFSFIHNKNLGLQGTEHDRIRMPHSSLFNPTLYKNDLRKIILMLVFSLFEPINFFCIFFPYSFHFSKL